jgi:hypothetical protein
MVFGSMKESDVKGGSYLKYIGANLPEGVTAGRQPSEGIAERFNLSSKHSEFIQQQLATKRAELESTGFTSTGESSIPSTAKTRGLSQSPTNLNVKGGGPSKASLENDVSRLKEQHSKTQEKSQRKPQAGGQGRDHRATNQQQPSHKFVSSDVALVMASTGSGF